VSPSSRNTCAAACGGGGGLSHCCGLPARSNGAPPATPDVNHKAKDRPNWIARNYPLRGWKTQVRAVVAVVIRRGCCCCLLLLSSAAVCCRLLLLPAAGCRLRAPASPCQSPRTTTPGRLSSCCCGGGWLAVRPHRSGRVARASLGSCTRPCCPRLSEALSPTSCTTVSSFWC
jgi:hypothetical protein